MIRISNPDAMLNEAVRAQNEAAAMMLMRDALASLPMSLVPAVYGWGRHVPSSKDSGEKENPGWILMEFMPGTPLANKFPGFNETSKREVLRQIAQIFSKIQAYQLPDSINAYGGLNFDHSGNVIVDATAVWGGGPSPSIAAFYAECLETQLGFADRCDIVNGWKDSSLRSRIDRFANEGLQPLLVQGQSDIVLRKTLVHGDFSKFLSD